MSRTGKLCLAVLLAVALISVIWLFVSDKKQIPAEETSQAAPCDSCAARHKNLTRLRDARRPAGMVDE